ncbi:MAG: sigma-70 family RNA polymerase sigma factor [Planctomycetes bacterium]|nr:sigma-70 family RNA polymerase sigma factor [Planctomycetota bacterium]
MTELEPLYERFRTANDLDALGEVFDRTAPDLLRLAAHLTRDANAAEDLVQETFLVAIDRRASYETGRPLLPWLLGILSNQAARTRRSRARRVDPDRLAPRDERDPAHVEEEHDTVAAVKTAVEDAPAPYRDVLRLHLFLQRTPAEIATELGRAPGTVRSQLMRGLEHLRTALPAGLAGAALLANASRGHAAMRERVLDAARASALPVSTSLTPIAWLAMLSLKTWITLGTATVALAAWIAWPSSPAALEPVNQELAARAPANAELELARELAPDADANERARSAPASNTSTDASAPRAARVVGVVQGLRPEDALDAEVVVTLDGRSEGPSAHPDRSGRFEIDVAALLAKDAAHAVEPEPWIVPGALRVELKHPRYVARPESVSASGVDAALARPERAIEVTLLAELTARVRGRVVGVTQEELELAHVTMWPAKLDNDSRPRGAQPDEAGRFDLTTTKATTYIVYAELPGLRSAGVRVELQPGDDVELPDFVLERGTTSIAGRVVIPSWLRDATAAEREKLSVHAELVERPAWDAWVGELPLVGARVASKPSETRANVPTMTARTKVAADGSFELASLAPGTWKLVLVGLGASRVANAGTVVVEAPAKDVVLGANVGRIVLRLRRGEEPVAYQSAMLFADDQGVSDFTDDHGRLAFVVDLGVDATLSYRVPDTEPRKHEFPANTRREDELVDVDLGPAAPKAELVLVPPATETKLPPRLDVEFTAEGDAAEPNDAIAQLEGGVYHASGLPAGRYRITVRPSRFEVLSSAPTLPEEHAIVLEPGRETKVELTLALGGRVRVLPRGLTGDDARGTCRLTRADGAAVDGAFHRYVYTSANGDTSLSTTPTPGEVSLRHESQFERPLAPGRYRLVIEARDHAVEPATLDFEIEAGATRTLELAVRPR